MFPHLCIDTGDSNEMPTPRIGKRKFVLNIQKFSTIKTFSYQSQRRQMRATNLKVCSLTEN